MFKNNGLPKSEMQNEIVNFYSQSQIGNGMPIFTGSRRPMVGGGFFGTLARFAMPLLKNIGGRVLRVAARTATDVLDRNQPVGKSLVDNAIQEVKSVLQPEPSINKQGSGLRKRHFPLEDDIFSRLHHKLRRKRQ
jgi:hypothetical protein